MGFMDQLFSGDVGGAFVTAHQDPFGDQEAARQQREAAEAAQGGQLAYARELQALFDQRAGEGVDAINQFGDQAMGLLGSGSQASQNTLQAALLGRRGAGSQAFAQANTGGMQALESLLGGRDQALGFLQSGLGGAQNALTGSGRQGRLDLLRGTGAAQAQLADVAGLRGMAENAAQGFQASDAVGQRGTRADALQDRAGGLFGGFEQDPGFQFRQQQGEQALERSQAAQGGRVSGESLKALSEFNQGLASQEFQNFQNRRMSELGAAQQSDASLNALVTNQAGRQDSAASQAMQAQLGLGQQGINAQLQSAGLSAEAGRMLSSQGMQAGGALAGLLQSGGQQQAGLAGDFASQIAGQQAGLGQMLAGLRMQNAQDMFGGQQSLANMLFGQNAAQADMLGQRGVNIANILTGAAGQAGGLQGGVNDAFGLTMGTAGGEATAQGNTMKQAASIAAMFSDERIKKNVSPADEAIDEMLEAVTPVTFEYKDKAHGDGKFAGVMAQDLQKSELGSEMVIEGPDGLLRVDGWKMMSALMATIARLHARIDKLEGE